MPSEFRDLTVIRVGTLKKNPNGSPFLECETQDGIVAFWGLAEETANIEAIQAATVPFVVRAQCSVPLKTERHALWVPWSSPTFIQAPSTAKADGRKPFDAEAARDEVTRLGRVLGSLLDRLEGKRPTHAEGLVPRIRRLSQEDARFPRRIASLMVLVAEMRNAAAHDEQPLTESESNAARAAWQAVADWVERRDS